MKVIILLALVFTVAFSDQWAVLVAGSNTYSNYRHQADVYHAYQTLVSFGFEPAKIITFAYNDIALSAQNPYKGKVFNKPTYQGPGVDVYDGVKIDYSGASVTPENFLAVLEGNSTQTKGLKVLELEPSDRVFVFFSDHGSPGLIAFPSKYLYADQLLQTFNKITGKFSKFVFYLEVIIFLFRHASLARCSKNCQTILASMLFQLPTHLNPLGELTAALMMLFKENTLVLALEISSVSTSWKILIPTKEISLLLSISQLLRR